MNSFLSSSWAITLRYLRLYRRDPNILLRFFYWPLLEIFMWSFLGTSIENLTSLKSNNFALTMGLSLVLWQIVARGATMIVFTFSEELHSYNLINLFSLPLKLAEWIMGVIWFCLITIFFVTLFSIGLIITIYKGISLQDCFFVLSLFSIPLIFGALFLGFIGLNIVILWGKRSIEISYMIIWTLGSFCGVYYPTENLPLFIRSLSDAIPFSAVFKALRHYIQTGGYAVYDLFITTLIMIVFTIGALFLFSFTFNRSRQKGIKHLMD
jgi:hypothetical protein